MSLRLRHFVFSLLILSFAAIGISPACKFISGENSYIEICSDNNEIKHISLAEAGLGDQNDHSHKAKQSDCLFCFASTHGKALSGTVPKIDMPVLTAYFKGGRGLYTPKSLKTQPFDARGPPTLNV